MNAISDVGIDIGVRRVSFGWPYTKTVDTLDLVTKCDRGYELNKLCDWLASCLPTNVQLWLETPFVSDGHAQNRTVSLAMAELIGCIQIAKTWDIQPQFVVPGTWKKEVIGDGTASKEDIADWLSVNHRIIYDLCNTQDEIDAFCIGLYGQMRSSGAVQAPVKKSRKKKVKNS